MPENQTISLPKFYETFGPVLEVLRDKKQINYNELKKVVFEKYYKDLPPELLARKTKGGEAIILNRIGWAKAYLKQAGLVEQPIRAMVQITEKGLHALESGKISLSDIKKDPQFISHENAKNQTENEKISNEELSPQDLIDTGITAIEEQVKSDVLEKMLTLDHYYFENVVLELFEKMGYGRCQGTQKSNDGGIDGVINQDELGLEKIYVQAKHYKEGSAIHETDIRNFIGAMSRDTHKGIFITTSYFDSKAIKKAYNADHKIILIDGEKLADLAYKHGIGVQTKSVYTVKEIDEDYFL